MRPSTLHQRLGSNEGRRLAGQIVLALLLVYVAGFASFYPSTPTNTDEAMYLRQAQLLLAGDGTVPRIDPLTGATREFRPSTYPPGTAALMAPLIWVAGWRGAYLLPLLSLVAGVLLTARWLADEGRSPLFALLVLGFPASLVLGRVCMSDAPSLAVVSLGSWLFWRGLAGSGRWWLTAGFVAGASTLFRPTNVLLFAPLFAGTVLRREPRCLLLVSGGLAGLAVRLVAHASHFDDSLYERIAYPFSPETVMERLPLYLFGLLVFVPGGLAAGLAYRGRRRPELVATVVLFFLVYVFQVYGMTEVGLVRRVVLALRYFIPLLPLLAFAAAEAVPRWWTRLLAGASPARRESLERGARHLVVAWIATLALACFGVHWAFDRWSRAQAEIAEVIHARTGDGSVVVTNLPATEKFLRELHRKYMSVSRVSVQQGDLERLLERHGSFFIVFVDRSDSDFFRRDQQENAAFVEMIDPPPELEVDRHVSGNERLRIWRVSEIRTVPAPPLQGSRPRRGERGRGGTPRRRARRSRPR